MKKIAIILIISTIMIILIMSSLIVYGSSQKNETSLEEKVSQELMYLNQYFISLLGDFNGLTIGDNRLQEKEPEIQSENTDFSGNTGEDASKENDNTKKTLQQEGTDNKNNKTDTSQNSILSNEGNYKTNWDKVQIQVEQLYQVWNTVSIDLHALNVDGNSILAFSEGLNNVTINIKNKDKIKSVDEIIKIYELLLTYKKSFDPNSSDTNILTVQSNIVSAYANVTNNKWKQAEEKITEAEKLFANMLNTVTNDYGNQVTMSQSYILVNELKKAIKLKDKEIFFIEYRNLMTKMDILVS